MVVLALELYWLLKAVHSLAITRLLRHLKRAAVPPPSAPARSCQARQPEHRRPAIARDDRYPGGSCAPLSAVLFAEAPPFCHDLLHDRIAIEHADRAAPIFFPRRPLRRVQQLGHELFQSGDTLFQGRFRHRMFPVGRGYLLPGDSTDSWSLAQSDVLTAQKPLLRCPCPRIDQVLWRLRCLHETLRVVQRVQISPAQGVSPPGPVVSLAIVPVMVLGG
jgi:hypothetical protein